MKIAICGSNSTGKTTLLKAVRDSGQLDDYVFIEEITRSIGKNFPINEMGGNETQLMIMNTHFNNLYIENSVMDRCMIDGYAYTNWLYMEGKVSRWVKDYAKEMCYRFTSMYDYIFYIPIEEAVPLEDDGVRSTSQSFRDGIDRKINNIVITLEDHTEVKIHPLKGSVEERLETFLKTIKNG